MVQIVLYMCEGKVLMDMLFSFKNEYHYTYPNTYMDPALLPNFYVSSLECLVLGVGSAPPSGKGVTGEGSLANKGTSLRGMDNNFLFLWVCVCYR